MKTLKFALLFAMLFASSTLKGHNTERGMLIGGVAGAIIGSTSQHTLEGVIIGATAGGVIGAITEQKKLSNNSRVNIAINNRRPYRHGTRYKMVVTQVIVYDQYGQRHVRTHYDYIPYR